MTDKYIALIPAYKPEAVLLDLLSELCDLGFECVVVDDGGGEAFADIFKKASSFATVLVHPVNRGKGAALKTGLSYIKEKFGDGRTVVTVDADGQHKVSDALRVCREAENHQNTLVLGSRKFTGHIPLRSKFGNGVTRFIYRLTTGLRVNDTQTGLRAFPSKLISRLLEISGDRYEYEMNMLLDFARHKIPIKELDIETVYIGKNETSHFNPLKDSFRIYKEILKFSASSFIGFLIDYGLYTLLVSLLVPITHANVIARVVSATVNFTLNRKFVFKSREPLLKSAIKYFLLAVFVLAGNTLLLNLLVKVCLINSLIAKIIAEVTFYFINWLAQRLIVFKKSNKTSEDQNP